MIRIQSTPSFMYSLTLVCRLDIDAKNTEILRLLPLMAPFTMEFTSMQKNLDTAVTRLEEVQVTLLHPFLLTWTVTSLALIVHVFSPNRQG